MSTAPTTNAYERALAHYRAGQADDAIAAGRDAVAATPDDPDAHNLLGVCLVSAGDLPSGIAVLTDAVQRWPDTPALVLNLALALYRAEDRKAALLWFRRMVVVQPENAMAWDHLGLLALLYQGDRVGACRMADRAHRLAPQDETLLKNSAMAWVSWDLERAASLLGAVITLRPDDAYAYVERAGVLMRQGRHAAALPLLNRALILDPANTDAANQLARCGRYQAAGMSAGALGAEPATGLVLRAPFGTTSGYAHMGRRYIQTLRAQAVPLQVIGIFGHEEWDAEPLAAPVAARAAVNMLVPLAVEPVPGLATVLYSMFEGPRISAAWARQSARSDLVIVPTESSRLAWASQGFPEDRLRVCPLGVDPEPAADAPALTLVDGAGRLVSSFRHRFLNISDTIPRKNLDGLLRVWLRCTGPQDDAVLILKPGKGGNREARAALEDIVRQTQRHVGKSFAEAAPVVLVDQPLSEADMTGLFRAASYYWSMSHGEGWDLPMSKAGAMGLGLIAPRHSAYVDYLDDRFARMIPSVTGPAHLPYSRDPWEPFHGLDWWDPDEDAAAAILTDIIHGRDPGLPDASGHLLGRFTWDQAARTLRRILADAGWLDGPS